MFDLSVIAKIMQISEDEAHSLYTVLRVLANPRLIEQWIKLEVDLRDLLRKARESRNVQEALTQDLEEIIERYFNRGEQHAHGNVS